MATSDELLNKMNESVAALQEAQQTVVDGAAALGNAVHKSGTETIAGTKTFTASPVLPDPTNTGSASMQAAPVSFVNKAISDKATEINAQLATNTSNITDIFTRLDDVSNWESTALMHNNIYRGANLLGSGHFSSIADIMTAVRAGNFEDIYVGDYIPASITVDGTADVKKFRVAAINLLNARSDAWGTTKPNLCIVPDKLGNSYMNSTNTSEGGYVGSYMYTDVLPKYYKAIAGDSGTPFNGYLQTTTERLTSAIDTSKTCNGYSGWTGAATGTNDYTNQNLTLMSEVEVYGHNHWSSTAWDGETIVTQLPMFRVNPGSITLNSSSWWGWWLRGVALSATFCFVYSVLAAACYGASDVGGVRPRFFIA